MGAGESTLERLFSGSRAAGHEWPLMPADCEPARVALVARATAYGLVGVQMALREWASGEVPVVLVGLVLVAGARGRMPRRVRERAELIATAIPGGRVWWLPWVRRWRAGEVPSQATAPPQAAELLADLRRLAAEELANP